MAKVANFGEKDWADESASGAGRSDFLNMKDDGQYKLRIVGKPHEFAAHWVEAAGQKKKVNCAGTDCVLCAKGIKSSVRYLVPAIFRKGPSVTPNTIAVTEFGPQVYGFIRNLVKDEEWGNPTKYDLTIDKNKSRGASGTYFVTPGGSKSDLSDDEKANVAEFLSNISLKEFSAPLTNQVILEKLGPEIAKALGLAGATTASQDSEDNFNFDDSSGGDDEYNFSA